MNATGEERRNALMGKGWARRTVHVHGVTPSGDAVLEAVDGVGRELLKYTRKWSFIEKDNGTK